MGAATSAPRLKHYGWGREGERMSEDERAFILGRYREKFERPSFETRSPPRLEDIALAPPRVERPPSLADFCSSEHYDRVAHTYGKSYTDYVRGMLGDYACAPDVVAYPRDEADIADGHGLGRRNWRFARALRRRLERLRRRRAPPG